MPPVVLGKSRPNYYRPAPPENRGPKNYLLSRTLWMEIKAVAADFLFPFLVDTRLTELAGFYRRLHTLVNAGFPIVAALRTLSQQNLSVCLKTAVDICLREVENGRSLSDGMRLSPAVFPLVHCEIVKASELGGRLEEALFQLTEYNEQEVKLRQFLSRQTFYPKVLFVTAVLVIPAIFMFIMGGNPLLFILLTFLSWLQIAVIICIIFALIRQGIRCSAVVRLQYEQFKWSLPGVGKVARQFAVVRFGRALAALSTAGISMPTALEIAGRTSGSASLLQSAYVAARAAEGGSKVSDSLVQSGLFPSMIIQLLQTGESSGNIDVMLTKSTDILLSEAGDRAHKISYVFSQFFYLAVALYIASRII